jgi:cysteinyl-tRNA synthetase|tara:strand:- start:28311 stop:29702 length:1392 start_codon:yes stop_codon:yes gene_type:complete
MKFKIYNTLSRSKEEFFSLTPGEIKMYVCGMTVYDLCHIGHGRAFVSFDLITRFLRYTGWKVTYVRNITDVDDKIIARAAERNESCELLTERYITAMQEDFANLGMLSPDMEPKATEHIAHIVTMIEQLIEKGYAYKADNGDVYYRVSHFAEYGKLSGKKPDELLAGARIEIEKLKEDPRDFVLWKAATADQLGWPTDLGYGRPGWHIECSAMSKDSLGETFDIHGGGEDLQFPHHENEIAQSEAANGCDFAKYWLHVGPLRINGDKMSKSLNNFFTIQDVLAKYQSEVVRFFLISSHYRSPINYSEDNLNEAQNGLERFYHAMRDVPRVELSDLSQSSVYESFIGAMSDDFNSREAISSMYELVNQINAAKVAGDIDLASSLVAELRGFGEILCILQEDSDEFLHAGTAEDIGAEEIERLIARRAQAKLDKDYAKADQIRKDLVEQGVQLDDSREATSWRRS